MNEFDSHKLKDGFPLVLGMQASITIYMTCKSGVHTSKLFTITYLYYWHVYMYILHLCDVM
jgi:hypothetical protein